MLCLVVVIHWNVIFGFKDRHVGFNAMFRVEDLVVPGGGGPISGNASGGGTKSF